MKTFLVWVRDHTTDWRMVYVVFAKDNRTARDKMIRLFRQNDWPYASMAVHVVNAASEKAPGCHHMATIIKPVRRLDGQGYERRTEG